MLALPSESVLTHNLRAELTSFIGRDNELREVELLIGDRRLVTLTGVGGCGKTRLAAQVCNRLGGRWPDGVWWIDLGSLSEPDLVVRTVASALGVLIEPKGDQLQALAAQLRQQHLLLCLDTCEHLLDAVAAVTDTVLRACPGVSVLTTSREPLGVAGETVWRVPSLRADEAVLLFTDRATLVAPGFTPGNHQAEVRSVCRRVDGIPLAIELAAAWAPALAPKQIASGLDESFRLLEGGPRRALPRHQALTASMEWSHALLEDGEQEVFRRLGVFAGSFSLDAARAVGSDDAGEDVLTRVRRLVDKSLVVVHGGAAETRYRLLDTVRQYAQERLRDAAEGDDEVFGLPVEWLDGGGVPGDVVGAAAVVGSTAERDLGSPVEGRGGAEVDHDARPAVQPRRGQRVRDPVGTDLARVVHLQGESRAGAGFDHHRERVREVAVQQVPDLVDHRGHGAAHAHAVDVRVRVEPPGADQAGDQHVPLVRRPPLVGRDPPVRDQVLAVQDAEHGVAVADVDAQQHGQASRVRRSSPMSSTGAEWVNAPTAT